MIVKPKIAFNKYYTYEKLIIVINKLVKDYPNLSTLHNIGKSYEGRDIYLVEITNKATGPGLEKPAFWMDGNLHAEEVTPSIANLKLIWYVLTEYGENPTITELLNERVLYILPRTNPDGAELFLTTPYTCRSSVKWTPYSREEWLEQEGLYPEDIDEDGWIVQMRIEDPYGDWKVSEKDSRLMIKRTPEDMEGPFYKIYSEGMILNWDGGEIKMAPERHEFDFNRSFDANYTPSQIMQPGSFHMPYGYAMSEPEIRAYADFVKQHPNISVSCTGHTHGGFLLIPPSGHDESVFIRREELGGFVFECPRDLDTYKYFGDKAEIICGYPMWFQSQRWHGHPRPKFGTQTSWWLENNGVFNITIEYWDIAECAGFGTFRERGFVRPDWNIEKNGLKLLEFNDKMLDGKAFIPWKFFEHSQLGNVEIGGWKKKFFFRNPPSKILEAEISKVIKFPLWLATQTPLVKITRTKVEGLGDGLYKIKVMIENRGFLASYVSQWAKSLAIESPVKVRIQLEGNIELIAGKKRVIIGDLEGASYKRFTPRDMEGKTSKQITWVVRSTDPTKAKIIITSISQKGGVDRKQITLENFD